MKNFTFLFVLFILFFSNCNREYYQTSAYETYAPNHHSIAVLPSQTITTGRIPDDWTDEILKEIEENESYAFQVAIFDEVAQRSGTNTNNISIDLQHFSETNALLKKAGISARESIDLSPSELATILGVDAVVRSTIKKDMYLTDLESYGVTIAQSVFTLLTGNYLNLLSNKTSEVFLSASILDGETSIPVWAMDKRTQTDWNNSHDEIVRNLANVMARRFPYRL